MKVSQVGMLVHVNLDTHVGILSATHEEVPKRVGFQNRKFWKVSKGSHFGTCLCWCHFGFFQDIQMKLREPKLNMRRP